LLKGEKKMFQQRRIQTSDSFGPKSAPTWKKETNAKNALPVLNFRALLGLLSVGFGLLAVTGNACASTTITGTVGSSGRYLVTGAPVTTTAVTVLKLSFENKTSGTNLQLCAGTAAEFSAGTCGTQLSDSGGPGFVFLTITDSSQLSGKIIFVLRVVGVTSSNFALTIE
jgi:hypothetical protein